MTATVLVCGRMFNGAAGMEVPTRRRKDPQSQRLLAESNVKIAYGTDCGMFPFSHGILEFHAMVKAGLSPVRALKAATSVAAELIGRDDIGVLAPGKLANIVGMPGDPIARHSSYRESRLRDEGRGRIPRTGEHVFFEFQKRLLGHQASATAITHAGGTMSTYLGSSDFERLHHRWGWFLGVGIVLIVLGILALVYTPAATIASVLVFGWLMFFSGIAEAVHAFQERGWGGVLLHVAGGALGILIGLLVVTHPIAGALGLTLLFASFLAVIGLFRMIAAISLRYRSWGWAVFDGIVTLVLGLLLGVGLPWSGLWFLGFTLGISLILRGWSTVMFAFAVRKVSQVIPIRRVA